MIKVRVRVRDTIMVNSTQNPRRTKRAFSVHCFERFDALDTALYKRITFCFLFGDVSNVARLNRQCTGE